MDLSTIPKTIASARAVRDQLNLLISDLESLGIDSPNPARETSIKNKVLKIISESMRDGVRFSDIRKKITLKVSNDEVNNAIASLLTSTEIFKVICKSESGKGRPSVTYVASSYANTPTGEIP